MSQTLTTDLTAGSVTPRWLTELLSGKYPGAVVESVSLDAAIQGASVKFPLSLTYNDAGNDAGLPSSMIVKGGFGRHEDKYNDLINWTYETEMLAYRDVLPDVDVFLPRIYFCDHEPLLGRPVILMEDLRERNAEFCRAEIPRTPDELSLLLDALARVHARWWNIPVVVEHGLSLNRWLDTFAPYLDLFTSEKKWDEFMALPRLTGIPSSLKNPRRLREAVQVQWRSYQRGPLTRIHADAHIGNALICEENYSWIDWKGPQMSWVNDVCHAIVTGLDIDVRRVNEQQLIKGYLEALRRYGVTDPPTWDVAWLSYRRELIYPLFIWVSNGDDKGELQVETINTACSVRASVATLDHGTYDLLRYE